MDMNYFQTVIAVAEDCPVAKSVVPTDRGAKKSVAVLQYEMLVDSPYVYTQEDVLFDIWFQRQNMLDKSEAEVARLRDEFFAKPQACLRSSPLPKKVRLGPLRSKGQGGAVPDGVKGIPGTPRR